VDAALAFVEAGPAAGAFVFAFGGWTVVGLAANGTVAACGEGVCREVAEEILQLLCDDLSKYTPLVASDCLDSVFQNLPLSEHLAGLGIRKDSHKNQS
jgi:hypothetical protein